MKNLLTRAVAILAIMSASFVAQAEIKVAIFNFQKVMAVSPQAEVIKNQLKEKFSDRTAEIQKIQQDAQQEAKLAQTNKDFWTKEQKEQSAKKMMAWQNEMKIKGEPLQREIQQFQQQAQQQLARQTQEALNGYAKEKGYDVVLEPGSVVYISDKVVDITDEVIARLK
ncbi:OmpH family outer membrane protein [Paraferrimonas sp. SM1919]|uniref:OmpH family outer membrane protein n=1 Tax=Paraferrimonas sp. SM1919 TaxID=2662263 RepID=UPI0013D5975B|nr:OmpH family outer membrane protein [Paraferrimonas sp. SM1919]